MTEAYLGDCMGAMAQMRDNEFDLAIVDPPYGIGNFSMETGGGISNPHTQKKVNYKSNIDWNNDIPTQKYFTELLRVSDKQVIWGANYYNCFSGLGGALVWYKNTGHKNLSQCEIASLSFQKKVDYLEHKKPNGFIKHIEYIHPCEKPIYLYKWLLKNYAKEGDSILDTHLGSGSSRIAAHDMGFDFTGYEIDKDYFDASVKRFDNHIRQGNLFQPKDMYQ